MRVDLPDRGLVAGIGDADEAAPVGDGRSSTTISNVWLRAAPATELQRDDHDVASSGHVIKDT